MAAQHGCQLLWAWQAISTIHLQNHQNANEIDSAGDNLSTQSDGQGWSEKQLHRNKQRKQTLVLYYVRA